MKGWAENGMSEFLRQPPPRTDDNVPTGTIRQASHNTGEHVYFIRPVGMDGPVKIGCSISPRGRKSDLSQWSPFPLEIAAQIPGDFRLERRFHAMFNDDHKTREWFDWSPELGAVIEAVAAGTFDVETLPAPKSVKTDRGTKAIVASKVRAAVKANGIDPYQPHIKTVYDDGTICVAPLQFIHVAPIRKAAA